MKRRIFSLLSLLPLAACSGNELCGIAFCRDQTGIQMQYVKHRDLCQQLVQMKSAQFPASGPDADEKAQLVQMFSDCMSQEGWAVPGPANEKKNEKADASGVKPLAPVQQDNPEQRQKRAAECSFARHDAPYSLSARNRAQACDAECADLRRLAPEAPKPAACP